ncbi:LysM peptidoglycan-binding domain-containing protein [Nesterenkonia sp. NBAIMH1]|uniref:LysM peptidoglycan-binding domain-containing protein n=1 Tax=Nesterenkonia sp. NBAIMH1 TaxID=2600320 RepID=UPI0011B8201E|nr:LysM peptidoglycan-binding domain-containing protein [Nesterenkonia sp. NBAIMH1]
MTTSTAPQSSGIHLTRRGRLVLLGLPSLLASVAVAAILIFGITGLMNQAQASSEHVSGVEAVEVTVAPGDTLWDLAHEAESEAPVQETIARIAEINGLSSSQVEAGQSLYLPTE